MAQIFHFRQILENKEKVEPWKQHYFFRIFKKGTWTSYVRKHHKSREKSLVWFLRWIKTNFKNLIPQFLDHLETMWDGRNVVFT